MSVLPAHGDHPDRPAPPRVPGVDASLTPGSRWRIKVPPYFESVIELAGNDVVAYRPADDTRPVSLTARYRSDFLANFEPARPKVADVSLYKNLYLDRDGRVGLSTTAWPTAQQAKDSRTTDVCLGTVVVGVRDGRVFAEAVE